MEKHYGTTWINIFFPVHKASFLASCYSPGFPIFDHFYFSLLLDFKLQNSLF